MDFVTKYTHISSFHVFMNPNHFVVQKERFFFKPQQVQVRHKKLSGLHFLSVIVWSDKESAHTVCVCVSYSVNDLFGCFCKAALLRCRHNTVVEMTQNKGRWWSWVCCCCLSWGCSCASQRSYVNMYVKLLEAHPKQKYWQSTNTADQESRQEHGAQHSVTAERFQSHVVHYSLKTDFNDAYKNMTKLSFLVHVLT